MSYELCNKRSIRVSAARGVPPLITASQHDVTKLTWESYSESAQEQEGHDVVEAFALLCTLAEILRETLVMAFSLVSIPHKELCKRRRRTEVSLDDWEDSLHSWEEA